MKPKDGVIVVDDVIVNTQRRAELARRSVWPSLQFLALWQTALRHPGARTLGEDPLMKDGVGIVDGADLSVGLQARRAERRAVASGGEW